MEKVFVRRLLVFCAIFLISAVNAFAGGQGGANDKQYVLSKLIPLAELMTSGKPALKDAAQLFGETVERKKGDVHAYIHGHGYAFTAYLTGPEDDASIFWCDIGFDRRIADVRFREIVPIYGKWKEIAVSKTSWVGFSYVNPRTGNRLVIGAHLFDPPKYPESPVFSIRYIPQRVFEKKGSPGR